MFEPVKKYEKIRLKLIFIKLNSRSKKSGGHGTLTEADAR
jgi:hypothetical protein